MSALIQHEQGPSRSNIIVVGNGRRRRFVVQLLPGTAVRYVPYYFTYVLLCRIRTLHT